MKKSELPFTIGEQYELHEFELMDVETIIIGQFEYDVYRCSKKLFDSFWLDGLMDIKLYYNADILARVDLIIKPESIKEVMNLLPSEREIIIDINPQKGLLYISIMQLKYGFKG
ncbi:hypothetical protein [Mangrovimonas futianensis]|uniref:hypothetical protein n=1 Tax=Mangrovimonas futianensis TaxID=2895523 RepID=UPI001E5F4F74|nr:hypothetical protein [Mangrovimonas futianensis]MCF1420826.1 hypothetical protein [Mangrovimonas futianensis]